MGNLVGKTFEKLGFVVKEKDTKKTISNLVGETFKKLGFAVKENVGVYAFGEGGYERKKGSLGATDLDNTWFLVTFLISYSYNQNYFDKIITPDFTINRADCTSSNDGQQLKKYLDNKYMKFEIGACKIGYFDGSDEATAEICLFVK